MLIPLGILSSASEVEPIVVGNPTVAGGTLSFDETYYYRTFSNYGNTESLIISDASLAAEILCVAGGGYSGDGARGGGGGAGGVRKLNFTLTPQTYTCYSGLSAENSYVKDFSDSFVIESTAGGKGGNGSISDRRGASGGSGGGGGGGTSTNNTFGGAGNAGGYSPSEGNAGGRGNGTSTSSQRHGAGGGGAGAAASNATSSGPSSGGVGTSLYSDWGAATGTGEPSESIVFYGGGGGGMGRLGTPAANGIGNTLDSTGGGGRSITSLSSSIGQPGYSGVVIVRYLITAVG